MTRHFADSYNAELTHELEHTLAVAAVETTLLDSLRAMTPEARRSWLRCAEPTQIRRLSECYAAEAGLLSDAELVATRERELLAKQAALVAEVAGVSATLPPMGLMQEIASEQAQLLNRLVVEAMAEGDKVQAARFRRERNVVNKAADLLLAGHLPQLTPDGSWLVKSAQPGGPVYRITRGHCTCPAGERQQACKHVAMIEIIDASWSQLASYGTEGEAGADNGDLPFPPATPENIAARETRAAACQPLSAAARVYRMQETAALGARIARARQVSAAA